MFYDRAMADSGGQRASTATDDSTPPEMTGASATDLAVVIPTRNRWDILRQTLAALANQSVSRFEVIVVVDGTDQAVPNDLPADKVVTQRQAGPAAARNHGVSLTDRNLVLFLGDDMIARRDLVAQHLATHKQHPESTSVVLGRVDWHWRVAWRPENRWLDRSGTQFDYVSIRDMAGQDVGFARFYSCNVSLHRSLFDQVGGFDDDFIFYYEDLDMGWRLGEAGMKLIYNPDARTKHRHAYRLPGVASRFEGIALGERMMAAKHDWFEPWFKSGIEASMQAPPVPGIWRALSYLPAPRSLSRRLLRRATRWHHQRVGPRFLDRWERADIVTELHDWLADDFDASQLIHHATGVEAEAEEIGDETEFYRSGRSYLYDLAIFSMSGTKDPYHEVLRTHVPPGSRVLDLGCGIGADGVRLLEEGYDVTFADFANPCTEFLRWRLERRGIDAAIVDIERDALPTGHDVAYAFDVIEHVDDPWKLLAEMEQAADLVLVNLLEEDENDHEHALHRALPIDSIVEHARERGLIDYSTHHGRCHLILYRGDVA